MFPTRTAAPSSGGGGRFDLKTPAGKNNAILAAGGVAAILGGTYYMGYWDTAKAKDTAASVKTN
ncbi:hypothetical protein C8F04DRAFT_1265114 [Mycena alexandri]|uniref:Uncharacterized protein n=1 Tax=Mycena alexandri TaxID=1745969 RepID=A0AAD6WYD7_9AGAR|nr:hypothetical protein C8F04DRAFT_1265114 [Mycena alexandri]